LDVVDGDEEAALIGLDGRDLGGQGRHLVLQFCHPSVRIVDLGEDLIGHGLDVVSGCHGGTWEEGG
jgi:hypothetical protein